MFRTSRLAFVVAMLSSSLALADAVGGQEKASTSTPVQGIRILRGLRPDTPRIVSHQKPLMKRLQMNAISWGVMNDVEKHLVQNPQPQNRSGMSRDPYRVTINNANEGTKLTVTKLGAARPIALPDPEGRAAMGLTPDGKKVKLPAHIRKQANKEFNAAVRKAIATARPEEPLFETTAPGPSSAQPSVTERPEVLATNTQLVVRGVDKFGRKYQPAFATVEGHPYGENAFSQWQRVVEGGNRYNVRSRDRWGGVFVQSVPAQIVKENLRMTPVLERPLERTGEAGQPPKRETYVKLLSLAGFSPRSQVTITNVRMQAEGNPAATRIIERTNRTGSGAIELPALLGDSFTITVATPKDANKQGATTSMTVQVPTASKNGVYFADRYLPLP